MYVVYCRVQVDSAYKTSLPPQHGHPGIQGNVWKVGVMANLISILKKPEVMLLYSTQLLDPNVFIDFPNDARVVAVFAALVSSKWSALSTLRTIVHFLPNYVEKYKFVKVIEAFQDSDAFLISQQQYCFSWEWHQSCQRKRFRCWQHWA